jgi:DNA-directed RNA polymerase specialized sigma24 family protein
MTGVDQTSEARAALELIRQCIGGSPQGAAQFQTLYGELIYGYPIHVFRIPSDEAGDFYVFAFDKGRIFRRLQTFEGRVPLRAYLLGFVLNDLVLEWMRGRREIETVPLDTVGDPVAVDTEANAAPSDKCAGAGAGMAELLAGLEPSKTAVLKLLYIEDCDLSPAEIRFISQASGRCIAEVLRCVDALRATVREREGALKQMEDRLDSVQSWIRLYERRLHDIDAELTAAGSDSSERLQQERTELRAKLERRQRQREKLLSDARRRKVTAPYKDIAALLKTTTGNIGSQLARVRRELLAKAEGHDHRVPAV